MQQQTKTNSLESSTTTAVGSIQTVSVGSLLQLNQQPDVFHCSRCSRGFPSSQSLGGHQNAHRRERNAERIQMMEQRKIILDKIKKAEATILSSLPPTPPPPPIVPTGNCHHQNLMIPHHFGISVNRLESDFNGSLAALRAFFANQAKIATSAYSVARASTVHDHDVLNLDALRLNNNINGDDEEISDGNENNSDDVKVEEEKESDEGSTSKKNLDLNLKL